MQRRWLLGIDCVELPVGGGLVQGQLGDLGGASGDYGWISHPFGRPPAEEAGVLVMLVVLRGQLLLLLLWWLLLLGRVVFAREDVPDEPAGGTSLWLLGVLGRLRRWRALTAGVVVVGLRGVVVWVVEVVDGAGCGAGVLGVNVEGGADRVALRLRSGHRIVVVLLLLLLLLGSLTGVVGGGGVLVQRL